MVVDDSVGLADFFLENEAYVFRLVKFFYRGSDDCQVDTFGEQWQEALQVAHFCRRCGNNNFFDRAVDIVGILIEEVAAVIDKACFRLIGAVHDIAKLRVTADPLVVHPVEHGDENIGVIVDCRLGFSLVITVQSADVLRERSFP